MVHHRWNYIINKNYLSLTKHFQRKVEITWYMVNIYKDMELQYTGKHITKHFGQPYLFKNSDNLNILADTMENRLGLSYTTHMINCNHHHKGFNKLCKYTVNPSFLRLGT